MKSKLTNEINLLSEEKIAEAYNFIHFFRLGIEKKKKRQVMTYCHFQVFGKK